MELGTTNAERWSKAQPSVILAALNAGVAIFAVGHGLWLSAALSVGIAVFHILRLCFYPSK